LPNFKHLPLLQDRNVRKLGVELAANGDLSAPL
jgi:hypothetical protein